jgi:tRNA A37 threonylcarbamoyladenosine synthetase subunit TsaC/SUA5/YrdC
MQAEIRTKDRKLFPEIVGRLEAGEVVVVPTDTTYAFIAHAFIPTAVECLMTLKRGKTPQPLGVFTCKERAADIVVLNGNALRMMEQKIAESSGRSSKVLSFGLSVPLAFRGLSPV